MDFMNAPLSLDELVETVEGHGGGGKDGGGSSATQGTEDPNTLKSIATAKLVFLLGEGQIKGLVNGDQGIVVNKVPFRNSDNTANFSGISYAAKNGTSDQTPLPGFEAVTAEYPVNLRVRATQAVTYRTDGTNLDAIVATLVIPALTTLDSTDGSLHGATVSIAIDLKSLSNPANQWTTPVVDTVSGKCTSPYERQYRLPLTGGGPWLVRMRRTSPDSDDDVKITDETYFGRCTEVTDYKVAYSDSAVVGVTIDTEQMQQGTDIRFDIDGKLIQYPSNYNPTTRVYTGVWNGTFVTGYCVNPAWVFYDVATNPRYGVGIPAALIDKWGLYQLAQFCDAMVPDGMGGTEPRFQFNGTLYNKEDAYKVLQAIASMMRSIVFYASGAVIIRTDMPMSPQARVYSPSNVVGEFSYSGTAKTVRHNACTVQFINPSLGYEDDFVVYEDRDNIIKFGYNNISLKAIGTTSRSQAYRQAKWTILTELLNTDTITFKAGRDSATVLPGDIVEVADPHWATADFGGRLLQPEAKNLMAAGGFIAANITKTNTTIGAERVPGPWGVNSLMRLFATAGNGVDHGIVLPNSGAGAIGPRTASVTVLRDQYAFVRMDVTLSGANASVTFDLDSKTVTATNAHASLLKAWIQEEGDGRLRLCVAVNTTAAGGNTISLYFAADRASTAILQNATGAETLYFGAPQVENGQPNFVVPMRPAANGTTQLYLDREIQWATATAPSIHLTLLAGATYDDIANVSNTGRPVRREIRYFASNVTAWHPESNMVTLQTAIPAIGNDGVVPLVWVFSCNELAPRPWKVIANEENDDKSFTVTGLNYDVNKFVRMDEGFIINYGRGEWSNLPAFGTVLPPANLKVEQHVVMVGVRAEHQLNISWDASLTAGVHSYRVTVQKGTANPVTYPDTTFQHMDLVVEPGTYVVGVKAIGPGGILSKAVTQGVNISESGAGGQQPGGGPVAGGGSGWKDRNIHISWVSRPLGVKVPTFNIRGKVTRPSLTVADRAVQMFADGGFDGGALNAEWQASAGTVAGAIVGGQLKVTNNGPGWLYRAFAVEVGESYTFTGNFITKGGAGRVQVGNTIGGTTYGSYGVVGLINLTFTATSGTIYIAVADSANGVGTVNVYDSFSLKLNNNEIAVTGNVGAPSVASSSLDMSVPTAPKLTLTGTFKHGDEASVNIGENTFRTQNLTGANQTSGYMAGQLATLIAADARFAPTAVNPGGAGPNVIGIGFVDGANVAQNIPGRYDWNFKRYKLEIRDPVTDALKRVEYTTTESYIYLYENNQLDFGGQAVRSVKVNVYTEDRAGALSLPQSFVASNPPPAFPTVNAIAQGGAIALVFTPPPDADYAGIEVHMSQTAGFTPTSATLVYDANGAPTIPANPSQIYYIKFRFYDLFGKTGIAFSSDMVVNTADITINGSLLGTLITTMQTNISTNAANIAVALAGITAIANDDILSAREKREKLRTFNTNLQAQYTQTKARAVALSLSTSAMDTAKANWDALLASYNPPWNDLFHDTTIYTHLFADKNFTTGWTNGNAATSAANGAYTTVGDTNAASWSTWGRTIAQAAAATQYSFAIAVKKDAIGAATRFPALQVNFSGGTVKAVTVTLDTNTGAVANPGTAADAFGVLDLGSEWLLWVTTTSNANNTAVQAMVYPAWGANANLTTASVAAVGSIDILGYPLATLGDATKLGHNMFTGRLTAYVDSIFAEIKAISGTDYGAIAGTSLKDSFLAVLNDSAVKNSAITISSGGILSGAGGGAVTITGLGYLGDLLATRGAPVGTFIGGRLAEVVDAGIGGFLSRIARVSDVIPSVTAPTLEVKGNPDSSVDLELKWTWPGSDNQIDGFIVTSRAGERGAGREGMEIGGAEFFTGMYTRQT